MAKKLCPDCGGTVTTEYLASVPKALAAKLRAAAPVSASDDLDLRIRLVTTLYPEVDAIRAAVAAHRAATQRVVPPPTTTAELTRLLVANRSAASTPPPPPKPRAVAEPPRGRPNAAPPAPTTAALAECIRAARAARRR